MSNQNTNRCSPTRFIIPTAKNTNKKNYQNTILLVLWSLVFWTLVFWYWPHWGFPIDRKCQLVWLRDVGERLWLSATKTDPQHPVFANQPISALYRTSVHCTQCTMWTVQSVDSCANQPICATLIYIAQFYLFVELPSCALHIYGSLRLCKLTNLPGNATHCTVSHLHCMCIVGPCALNTCEFWTNILLQCTITYYSALHICVTS